MFLERDYVKLHERRVIPRPAPLRPTDSEFFRSQHVFHPWLNILFKTNLWLNILFYNLTNPVVEYSVTLIMG
jgi:hypothetical protein